MALPAKGRLKTSPAMAWPAGVGATALSMSLWPNYVLMFIYCVASVHLRVLVTLLHTSIGMEQKG